ncbi:uncharacterized protein LOC129763352 [Toxorhynchites rutilus septentrionalis]|uniref:uncharacterized protein LOC129763352 n=1 Tax=Toxorhynchites rutilus septentrionalis TaxID=329112 RepID=UPI0024784B4F|nr:uncharacterized protein LOC129763352 [Toxorhynchites rutilus septentrionalis]
MHSLIKFFVSITLVMFTQSELLEIRDLMNDPILLLKINDCKLRTGSIKIIHPINITNLENNVHLFSKLARQIDRDIPISNLILQKSKELVNNLYQLKPMKPRRTRRWDTLGAAWKWIAGSPDADDLRIINTTLNNLITQNNQQTIVNNIINNRIDEIMTTANRLVEQQSTENKILLEEMDAVMLLLYMDTTNTILEDLEDTILRTRIELANSKLLSLKEILTIETLLNEQGIETQFPEEALNYAQPKIATRGDLLLYILQVPKVKGNCDVIQIIPLTVQNTVITDPPQYVIRSGNDLFKTTNPSSIIQQDTFLEPLRDNCSAHIILGKESHCTATFDNSTRITLIAINKILVNNAKGSLMKSNCGPHNRTLDGNFLISFNNCSVQIDKRTFTSDELVSNTKELQGAFPSLAINWNILQQHDIPSIHNQTIHNRMSLEHVALKQFEHKNLLFAVFGGLSTSMIILIVITATCVFRKRVVIKIRKRESSQRD